MVGMILDVFPSYKDKDMVDLLYQFERATGLSLNILVEKYLEKLLYEKGYLTVPVDEGSSLDKSTATDEEKKDGSTKTRDEDCKYIYRNPDSDNYRVQRKVNGHTRSFGAYPLEESKKVRDFLIKKNWDLKYTQAEIGLKGKEYRKWMLSEMEKELKE